jgi:hypothetical protein
MSPKTPIRILLPSLALVALVSLAIGPSAASARPFETGIFAVDSPSTSSPIAIQRVKNAGGRYLKLAVYWSQVAPGAESATKPAGFNATNPGDPAYNWGDLDATVRTIRAGGLEPVLNVHQAPRWARDPSACTNLPICSPRPADFADFGAALASRYSGSFNPGTGVLPRVTYYQAWVEPNLFLFFLPQFQGGNKVAAGNYRGILNAFTGAVKAVNPSNLVISAGLAPLQRPGGVGPLDFVRQLLCMQGRKKPKPKPGCNQTARFDILAHHPYTTGGPTHHAPGPDDVSLGDLPQMTQLLRAADRAGKIQSRFGRVPFWVTEFSWDSKPPDPGGLPWKIHARWVAEGFYRMWKAGVSTVLWFALRDQALGANPGDTYQSGLYLPAGNIANDTPKRALAAFQFPFVALKRRRGGIFVWGRTPGSTGGGVRIELSRGGGFRRIARLRADRNGIFTKVLRTRSRRGSVRAKAAGQTSLPFSLKYVKDFYIPPFGGSGQSPGGGGVQ